MASYTGTTNDSVVFYSCNPGLVPAGRMRAVCTEDGWSPNSADLSCGLEHVGISCRIARTFIFNTFVLESLNTIQVSCGSLY